MNIYYIPESHIFYSRKVRRRNHEHYKQKRGGGNLEFTVGGGTASFLGMHRISKSIFSPVYINADLETSSDVLLRLENGISMPAPVFPCGNTTNTQVPLL